MTFTDWIAETKTRLQTDGLDGVKDSTYDLKIGALRRISNVYNPGTPIYEHDWDVLIILDACRYDLMRQVEHEYNWLETTPTMSAASASNEWMERNFCTPEYKAQTQNTAYVTGNPFTDEYLDENQFHTLDEVWRYEWDGEVGTIRAEPILDRATDIWRTSSPDQMIVHLMQPHNPFIPQPDLHQGIGIDNFGDSKRPFWEDVRHGVYTNKEAWDASKENLRYVLNCVERFLTFIDADRVAITADHGNAMGERGVYGHPAYVPIKALREVPLGFTTATDNGQYQPSITPPDDGPSDELEEKLESLGYM